MGMGCWGGFGGWGDTRTLLLALLPGHSGQGKAPGHGASNDGDRLGKGAHGSEVTVLLGGAPLREEPWEKLVPPATGSAGLVWERCIERQLTNLAV